MNPSVLILEPDALQRDIMVLALRRHQLEVAACADPQEAFKILETQPQQLLIIDLLLRGQNGLDFLSELKQRNLLEGLKILVVSPLGFPEIVLKAARAGVGAYMVKPVDPEQLAEKVLQLLSAPSSQ
jgi:CheY-like chemotaxis protein